MTTKSMGISRRTKVFHGTTGQFDDFDISYSRQPSTPLDEPKAVFFTTDYNKALAHAKRKALLTKEEPVVITAYIEYKKLYDATAAIRVNRHKFKTYSQTKRYIYNKIDTKIYDAVEIRGDDLNTPEIAVFNVDAIKILKDRKVEASDLSVPDLLSYYSLKGTVINSELRKNKISTANKDLLKQLDDLISIPSHNNMIVYRGMRKDSWNYTKYKKGMSFIDKGFTSTSSNLETALKFCIDTELAKDFKGPYYVAKIEVPKNTKLFNYKRHAKKDYGFDEIVIKRNTKYKILNIDAYKDKKGREINMIDMKIISDSKAMEASDFSKLLCWIDQDGKEIDVTGTDQTHAATFRRLLDNDAALKERYEAYSSSLNQNSIYLFATRDLGWIRASGHGRYFYCMVTKNKVSSRAVSALARILKDYPEYDDFMLDYYDPYDDRDNKQFHQLSDLIKELRGTVNKNLTASFGEYGYWLHDGKIAEVDHQGHQPYANKHFKDKEGVTLAGYKYAFKKGWIRAVNERYGNLSIEFWYGHVTRESLKALSELINKHNIYKGFTVELKRGINDAVLPEPLRQRWFIFKEGEERQVLDLVRQCLDKTITASDDYGFWITDKGDLLKVNYESHNNVADKYIHDHFYKEYLEWVQENDTMDSVEFALTKGFIRLVVEGNLLNVEVDKSGITRDAYKTMAKFYNDHYFDSINLDASFQRRTTSSQQFSDYKENLNKFLTYMRTYIRKNNMQASDTVYGYWITADGALLKVPTDKIGHAGVLKKYDKNMFTAQQWERIDGADYYAILGKGWIRIAIEGYNNCNVEILQNSVTREAYKKLVVLLKSNKYNDFNLDIQRGHGPTEVDYDTFDRAGQLLSAVEKNINRDKTIVAIDEDNNVTGRYSQIAIERWQPDNSVDQIQLLNIGPDFVIRSITGSESSELTPFKFVETARKALLDMVRDMERAGIVYKRQAITPIPMQAADDVVLKRWETAGGKHAITLSQTDNGGYSIDNYIKLPSSEFKSNGSSFLGRASLQEALTSINGQLERLNELDGGFKEVRVGKVLDNLVPKKEAQKTAQVTVRGKVQDQLNGFTKFSKQPDFPGLVVYVKKTGAYTYARLVHDRSNLTFLDLSNKPLSISPTELVQRINISKLKNFNWSLPQEQLFNKYGPSTLANAAITFNQSLDVKMQDKTDLALEDGLKAWVKDYIIALYFKRAAESKRIQKSIDGVIQKQGLDKNKVYFYYGNPAIKTDETWKRVGLERIGTSSPYTYRFASMASPSPSKIEGPKTSILDQALALVKGGATPDSAAKKLGGTRAGIDSLKQDIKLALQRAGKQSKEEVDRQVQSQGDYTWVKGGHKNIKGSLYTLNFKGGLVGYIFVDDLNLVKTLQSFGNNKTDPTVYDSPYVKDLSMEKGPDSNIYASYDLYSGKKKVGVLYRPTPDIFGIVKRINRVTGAAPVKPKEVVKLDPAPIKSGMVGSFVSGTDKFGDRVEGILLTEKKNPRTHKSEGTAVIIDEDDVPIKVSLKGVRRKLTKAPKELLRAYKVMTASTRLEAMSSKRIVKFRRRHV